MGMEQTYTCRYCGKDSKKKNLMSLRIHEIRCDKNPEKKTNMKIPSRKGKYKGSGPSKITQRKIATKNRKDECIKTENFICIHCKKDCKLEGFKSSFASLSNHESQCTQNPNRIINRKITEESRRKWRDSGKKQIWSDERRARHRTSMKLTAKNYPESYTSANRGRVKQIEVDGLKLHGNWEVLFYQWAKDAGFLPERCLKSFSYEWNGTRSYYPDFYLPTLNLYIEVKGYETEQDRAKWNHFPERLIVLKKKEIEQIKKGTFRGLI
jgi:hypothetical protein